MTLILALVLDSDGDQSEDPGVQGLRVHRNTRGANEHLENMSAPYS